jgi:hypothetical protein
VNVRGDYGKLLQRKREVALRAKAAGMGRRRCGAVGCTTLTRAGAGAGLNNRYCKAHEEHQQRHGSPFRGSYSAAELNPYRRAAFEWLTANADGFFVKRAIAGVHGLYLNAGQRVEAFRMRGLAPRDRAKATWARLREAQIDARVVLAAWLAVELIISDDPQPVLTAEYKRVQAAKVVHRIVSGSHKRWEIEKADGRVAVTELHKYPASRGRVLRHIGEALESVAELVVDKHLAEIAAFKSEREAAGKSARRAYPESVSGRPKRTRKAPAEKRAAKPAAAPEGNQKAPRISKLPDGTIVTNY